MSFKDEYRNFFVIYNNGEVFYFSITKKGHIYSREFSKLFGEYIPAAHFIEFTENGFNLQYKNGEVIYSLEDYKRTLNQLRIPTPALPEDMCAERIYIDNDVRTELLEKGILKYNLQTSKIPGLLCEPIEENKNIKTYTKKQINNKKIILEY